MQDLVRAAARGVLHELLALVEEPQGPAQNASAAAPPPVPAPAGPARPTADEAAAREAQNPLLKTKLPEVQVKRPRATVPVVDDFLRFERIAFGEDPLLALDDPFFVRYGEYRYILGALTPKKGETIIDVGCEYNILMLFLASRGANVLGIDFNPDVGKVIETRKRAVESVLGKQLDITFRVGDGTNLALPEAFADHAIAVSAIEHFFSDKGNGDTLALESLSRVVKPGGTIIVTVPMSNGGPFQESVVGDQFFGYAYRLYTPQALRERLLNQRDLELVDLHYLAQTTPDTRYSDLRFHQFWFNELDAAQRRQWAWANAILTDTFNPIVSREEGEAGPQTLNTALMTFRRRSVGC